METLTLTKLTRLVTSLAVVIPKEILTQMQVLRGDYFSLTVRDRGVIVLRALSDADIRALKTEVIQYD